MVYMQGAKFGAALQGRNVLAGVEQPPRVKRCLDRVKQGDFVAVELRAHLIDLFPADAMLAGNAATHRHAQLEDLAADGLSPLQLARHIGVKQDQWVHIAIAGMKHIGHAQPIFGGQLSDRTEHPRQLAAGIVPSMQ